MAFLVSTGCAPDRRGSDGGGTGTIASESAGDVSASVGTAEAESTGVPMPDGGHPFECSGARWYEGNATIMSATDIEAMRDVGGITGSLWIEYSTDLANLDALSCLEVVGEGVHVFETSGLTELRGLERLRSVGELAAADAPTAPGLAKVQLLNNQDLERVVALESLETIAGLVFAGNPALVEIELPSLRTVGDLTYGLGCFPDALEDTSLGGVGRFPVLETVETLRVEGQLGFTSLASLVELAERGVVFENAGISRNPNLDMIEVEAFAAAAGIDPVTCSNKDEPEECEPCPGE
jgi:hypothetical protein